MFHLNGSRRPSPIGTITFKSFNHNTVYQIQSFFRTITNDRRVAVVDLEMFQKKFRPEFGFVDWNSKQTSFNKNSHHILFNMEINKKHATKTLKVFVYILPKEWIQGEPQQMEKHFVASINPLAEIRTQSELNGNFVSIYKVQIDNNKIVNVKLHKEACHLAKGDMTKVHIQKAIIIDGVYYEVGNPIKQFKEVDINEYRLIAVDRFSINDIVFEAKVEGIQSSVKFTKDVNKLADGFYRVMGVVVGAILVETTTSVLTGSSKKMVFLKDTSADFRRLQKQMDLIETV